MSRLAPLSEEPVNEDESNKKKLGVSLKKWLKTHFTHVINKKSDLRILLSVLGCPLFPVSANPKHSNNLGVSSSAEYIIHHFTAATGCRKIAGRVKNVFTTGKVKMAMVEDQYGGSGVGNGVVGGGGGCTKTVPLMSEKGCFVMWQMMPDKWLIELVVGGQKVMAGSDGCVAWRHTPWIGAHAAKGTLRPLRRALQGLDPILISSIFSSAQYVGEKTISGVDCFVLKLSSDQADLTERSDTTAEMIKHVIFGHFSQRSGFLVYLEDSYLTRIQSPGSYPTYWETSMASKIEDYRQVQEEDGVMIAHSGRTSVIITRFGDNLKEGVAITRMEETWVIDDVAFDVPGLSVDCFIPPHDVKQEFSTSG